MQWGFPGGSVAKNPPANAGDEGSIPGLGRSPGEANGYPLQYSCLGNPLDRGAWQATVHGGHRVGHDFVIKQQYATTQRGLIAYHLGNQGTLDKDDATEHPWG